jgi:hypothetical protein
MNSAISGDEQKALSENIIIRLQGSTTTGIDIDLSLTGIGPKFAADQTVGDDGTVVHCEYLVSESDAEYRVSYTISVRVKVVTQVNRDTTNIQYQDLAISGNLICAINRPLVIVRNGLKPLQLTITKEAEQAGADQPATKPADKVPAEVQPPTPTSKDVPR